MNCLRSGAPKGAQDQLTNACGQAVPPLAGFAFTRFGAAGFTGDCALKSDEGGLLLGGCVPLIFGAPPPLGHVLGWLISQDSGLSTTVKPVSSALSLGLLSGTNRLTGYFKSQRKSNSVDSRGCPGAADSARRSASACALTGQPAALEHVQLDIAAGCRTAGVRCIVLLG